MCVGGLQACDITISSNDTSTTPANENTVATFDCDKQSKMKFREENSNITLDGQCESVQIVGKNNTFIIAIFLTKFHFTLLITVKCRHGIFVGWCRRGVITRYRDITGLQTPYTQYYTACY